MKSYVSISNDFNLAAPTPHDGLISKVCADGCVPMFWPPGMATGSNQLTHTVFHQKLPICQVKHNIGPLIPHVSIPPDLKDPLHAVASSRKHTFGTQKVKANKKGLAATGLMNLARTPCLTCADPISILHMGNINMMFKNRVLFGISQMDLALGGADALTEMIIDGVGTAKTGLTGWALKTAAANVKGIAVGAYDFVTEDGEAEIAISISLPFVGDLYGHKHGLRRDENGNLYLFRRDRVGSHEVGGDVALKWPPEGDFHYDKLGTFEGNDIIVERDGKKYRYEADENFTPGDIPKPSDSWGRVTPEDDE